MENKEDHKHATVEMPTEQEQNKEDSSTITKFALGDEYHKFDDEDEVNNFIFNKQGD